jgi:FMN-dependent NADH-azoreductase
MNILHIDSSISGPTAASRQLTAEIVSALRRSNPAAAVTQRDLDSDPLPHLSSKAMAALAGESTGETAQDVQKGVMALEEFLGADVIVIGAPMYNFTIPGQLHAWIDRILIAGKTFRYTEQGPRGLAGGKTVIIASSRGGIYEPGTPQASFDFQETYLRAVFGFIGVEDVSFVRAEGLAFGPEQRQASIDGALQSVSRIVTPFAPAKAA